MRPYESGRRWKSESGQGRGRMGGDGTRVFCCSICYRIEVSSYEGWIYHLGTREHQENMRGKRVAMRWRDNAGIRKRCLVIKGIEGKKSYEILEFLKIWGEVEDFQYNFHRGENGKSRHCLVLYRDSKSANYCAKDGVKSKELSGDGADNKLEIYFLRREKPEIFNSGKDSTGRPSRKRSLDDWDSLYRGR